MIYIIIFIIIYSDVFNGIHIHNNIRKLHSLINVCIIVVHNIIYRYNIYVFYYICICIH